MSKDYSLPLTLMNSINISYKRYNNTSKHIKQVERLLVKQYGDSYSKEIRCLLSFTFLVRRKGAKHLTYSRRYSSFTGTKINYRKFIRVLSKLESDGYISLKTGGIVSYDPYLDLKELEKSTITPLEPLYKLIDSVYDKVTESSLPKQYTKSDFVVIKVDGENKVTVGDTDRYRMEDFMQEYNDLFPNHEITVEFEGDRVPLNFIAYKRSFVDDLDNGGRYYDLGGYMSSLPQVVRKTLEINGESVVELDFSSLHPFILYDKIGYQCDPDFKPYAVLVDEDFGDFKLDEDMVEHYKEVSGQLDYNPVRNFLKLCLLIALNCHSTQQASRAINAKYNSDKAKWEKWEKGEVNGVLFYGLTEVDSPHSIMRMLEHHNKPIADFFFKGSGLYLQRLDSDIATYVIEHFAKKNEVALSWHDSFIVRKSLEGELRMAMENAYERVLESKMNCRIDKKY